MSVKEFFRAEWAEVAPAWERWGPALERQSAAATAWLLDLADVRPGMAVLDLASGAGDPALEAPARRLLDDEITAALAAYASGPGVDTTARLIGTEGEARRAGQLLGPSPHPCAPARRNGPGGPPPP